MKKFNQSIALLVIYSSFLLFSCKKKNANVDANATVLPMFIIGNTVPAADIEVTSTGSFEECGIVWSTNANPTVDCCSKATANGKASGKYRIQLGGLSPRTVYFVRGYAITASGVKYSSELTFKTIGAANLTYTFQKMANPTEIELNAYNRIQMAIDGALNYLNRYTSASKHFIILYDATVLTADGSSNGTIRFGSNPSNQSTHTMIHEMNHALGTGTSDWWMNTAMPGNAYVLLNANEMVSKISGGKTTVISSCAAQNPGTPPNPRVHWDPYGLCYVTTADDWIYVYNALIIEAMRKDGMPTAGVYQP